MFFSKLFKHLIVSSGENDDLPFVGNAIKLLKYIPKSKEMKIKDAGHPCYLHQPAVWHQYLTDILNELETWFWILIYVKTEFFSNKRFNFVELFCFVQWLVLFLISLIVQ